MKAETLFLCAISIGFLLPLSVRAVDPNQNYTYIYFENGYPTPLKGRRPQSAANLAARANPDLVIQTGYYSLRIDCDDMQLTGYDALDGSDYLTALNQDVNVFSPADLLLRVTKDGVDYTCTSGIVQSETDQYVRLIASGQFVQRIDHLGAVFRVEGGRGLSESFVGRVEVTAWPDRVAFKLDVSEVPGVTQTAIELTSPGGILHQAMASGNHVTLALQPHLDQTITPLSVPSYIREATHRETGEPLDVRFDEDELALHIDVPADKVSYPADTHRVDEYVIEVTNPGRLAKNIPLVFDQVVPRAITGTVMTLCEDADGRPAGLPVQISKNWHKDKDNPSLHEGPWLRGHTLVTLEARETRRFRLRVIYGYWSGVGAVSHAQLCLVGWGGHWKWDESALGAWGEAMCYDPSQHLGSSYIGDVRPSFTTSMSGGTHNWTENVGGGDFLIYYDRTNTFRWAKRLKTAYRWTGPNMTEVRYSGISDDEKIRFTYTTRLVRTNDYHRRFHAYQYRFLEDVTTPRRLVFHQMAADYYTGPTFTHYYRGDETGLLSSYVSDPGGNAYKGTAIPFDRQWLAIDDETSSNGTTKARRGIISMTSTLNGTAFPLYLHTYGRSWGTPKLFFDLSSDSVRRSYAAGDVVEGELEFLLPSKTADNYWGADSEFRERLIAYRTNPWQAVYDEYRYNIQVPVTVQQGTLLRNYPVTIQASETDDANLADLTLHSGGIGHVPVVLKGVPKGSALQVDRYVDGMWVPLESVDIHEHDYYQGYLNTNDTIDCVFNIKRPSLDLDKSWRIRILKNTGVNHSGTAYL